MTLATSQGNQPSLARLPTGLPKTQAEWTQFVNVLQAWQRGVQTVTWQAPTLLNSWVYYGSPYEPPGFYMDATGRVHLRGLLKSGTVGLSTPLFTLPAGYVPTYEAIFPAASNALYGEVRVFPSGNVCVESGSNAWVSLASISFSTQ
jgi:hypothetical protein